jgi:hypothetical protein
MESGDGSGCAVKDLNLESTVVLLMKKLKLLNLVRKNEKIHNSYRRFKKSFKKNKE